MDRAAPRELRLIWYKRTDSNLGVEKEMIARITFSEIVKITDSMEMTVIDFQPSKIPPIRVDVATMAEFNGYRDNFIKHCEDSGLCGRIYSYKVSGRALNGFSKLGNRLVNRHVGEAAPDV